MGSVVQVQRQPPRKKRNTQTSFDIPEDVAEKIFSFLPYKKLCSLSILSKRYINSWKLCRNLSFDGDFAWHFSRDECISIVDRFFKNHQTPCADRFVLHLDANDEGTLINSWINEAIRLGIEELELDLITPSMEESARLDTGLVDAESLKILKLVNCELHLPFSPHGLRNVQELTLQNVSAGAMLTHSIFANCESLRVLRLIKCARDDLLLVHAIKLKCFHILEIKNCLYMHAILIQAPSLRTFHYHGKIVNLGFIGDMPNLTNVVLDIAYPKTFQVFSNRNGVLERLAHVEVLTVTSVFLEGLCSRYVNNAYKMLDFSLPNLKEFHLIVAPESFLNPHDVVLFLMKCPIIERLFIDLGVNSFSNSLHWEIYGKIQMDALQTTFPFLKYVKIKGFTARELPMYIARFFLKNAINLDSLILVKARLQGEFPFSYYSPEHIRWDIISDAEIGIHSFRADKKTLMPQHL